MGFRVLHDLLEKHGEQPNHWIRNKAHFNGRYWGRGQSLDVPHASKNDLCNPLPTSQVGQSHNRSESFNFHAFIDGVCVGTKPTVEKE